MKLKLALNDFEYYKQDDVLNHFRVLFNFFYGLSMRQLMDSLSLPSEPAQIKKGPIE